MEIHDEEGGDEEIMNLSKYLDDFLNIEFG